MSSDFVEFLSDNFRRLELIEQMTGFSTTRGTEKLVVVFKSFHVVVGIGVEKMAEYHGVRGRLFCPHFPQIIGQRVFQEFVPFVAGTPVVLPVTRRLSVGIFGCIEWLRV